MHMGEHCFQTFFAGSGSNSRQSTVGRRQSQSTVSVVSSSRQFQSSVRSRRQRLLESRANVPYAIHCRISCLRDVRGCVGAFTERAASSLDRRRRRCHHAAGDARGHASVRRGRAHEAVEVRASGGAASRGYGDRADRQPGGEGAPRVRAQGGGCRDRRDRGVRHGTAQGRRRGAVALRVADGHRAHRQPSGARRRTRSARSGRRRHARRSRSISRPHLPPPPPRRSSARRSSRSVASRRARTSRRSSAGPRRRRRGRAGARRGRSSGRAIPPRCRTCSNLAVDSSADVRFWAVRGLAPAARHRGGRSISRRRRHGCATRCAIPIAASAPKRSARSGSTTTTRRSVWCSRRSTRPDTWLSVSAAEALGRFKARADVVVPRLVAAAAPARPTALRMTALHAAGRAGARTPRPRPRRARSRRRAVVARTTAASGAAEARRAGPRAARRPGRGPGDEGSGSAARRPGRRGPRRRRDPTPTIAASSNGGSCPTTTARRSRARC